MDVFDMQYKERFRSTQVADIEEESREFESKLRETTTRLEHPTYVTSSILCVVAKRELHDFTSNRWRSKVRRNSRDLDATHKPASKYQWAASRRPLFAKKQVQYAIPVCRSTGRLPFSATIPCPTLYVAKVQLQTRSEIFLREMSSSQAF